MNQKSISELIHDRVFAEGGTLVVWLNDARFRRVLVAEGQERIRPRRICENARLEGYAADSEVLVAGLFAGTKISTLKFEPSAELSKLIARNAEEVRDYLNAAVREWNRALEDQRSKVSEPATGPSGEVDALPQRRKGRVVCDCHAVTRSAISPLAVKNAVLAGALVSIVGFGRFGVSVPSSCEVLSGCGEIRRVELASGANRVGFGPAGGEASRFSVLQQGEGGRVSAPVCCDQKKKGQ